MTKIIRICLQLFIGGVMTGIGTGCSNMQVERMLQQADSLTTAQPDSAVALLQAWKQTMASQRKAERMRYGLLRVKANDKARRTNLSNTLIKEVVDYYERKNDRQRLPEAYYYAARVMRTKGDAPMALDYLRRATEVATREGITDYRLLSMMHNQLGMIFYDQDIRDHVPKNFRKALHYTRLAGDSALMVYNLRDMGTASTIENKADSALFYYQNAVEMARTVKNKYLENGCRFRLIDIYIQLQRYKEAYREIRQALPNLEESLLPTSYAVRATYYEATGQTDSADYYYNKEYLTGNLYQKRAGARGLGTITYQRGNYKEAYKQMELCLTYTDSISRSQQAEEVIKADALYNYSFQQAESQRVKVINKTLGLQITSLIITLFLILSIGAIYYLMNRKNRRLQQSRMEEKLKAIADEQYRNSLTYVEERRKQMQELEQRAQQTHQRKSELQQQIEADERQLLELESQRIALQERVRQLTQAAFHDSPLYHKLKRLSKLAASPHENITDEDWQQLTEDIDAMCTGFIHRLNQVCPALSEQELHISLLLRIEFVPTEIACLVNRSKQAITSARKKLAQRIAGEDASPDQWDRFVKDL